MSEVAKAAHLLIDAANFFVKPVNGKPKNVKIAVQCLCTALSFVLPPSKEIQLRLMLGEIYLQHTSDPGLALEQLQKAQRLLQQVPLDNLISFRVDSALLNALVKCGRLNIALPHVESTLKRCEEVGDWNFWAHFYLQQAKITGVCDMVKFENYKSKLTLELVEFIDIILRLVATVNLAHQESIEELIKKENLIMSSSFSLLNYIYCLIVRLKHGYSDGFKQFNSKTRELLSQSQVPTYPAHLSLKHPLLLGIAKYLHVLALARFQIADLNLPKELSPTTFGPFDNLIQVELACLQSRIDVNTQSVPWAIQVALISCCSGSPNLEALETVMSSSPQDDSQSVLWRIQMISQLDVQKAKLLLKELKSNPSFVPCPYFHLLEAILLIKSDSPKYMIKY